MSRKQAKRELTIEYFEETMEGIVSTSVNKETLDEAPAAYKDYLLIEDALEPTANIIHRVLPLLNIKA